MVVSNLVQKGADLKEIADALAISENLGRTYISKAQITPAHTLKSMIISNLLPTGATDEEIANVLSLPVKTVEKYISNVPMRINQEETVSSLGLSSDYKVPYRSSPNKSEAEEDTVTSPSQAPKPTITPTPTSPRPEAPKSTDTPVRTLLAILGLVLSPLLLIFHSQAMRTRTRAK
tara:strand:- start:153 stop:680 length:528 start_codon:yes stop_codon:yes gene_type:complete